MKSSPQELKLEQVLATCKGHEEALGGALEDLDLRELEATDIVNLSKEDRRLLDQFAYRYTRLQDDMGARLFPAVLSALGEDITAMPAVDRFDRLEQLEWLPSAEEWMNLRQTRNEFTHEYPETAQERYERLQTAINSAWRLVEIFDVFKGKAGKRFSR